jgi:hypothetical protein
LGKKGILQAQITHNPFRSGKKKEGILQAQITHNPFFILGEKGIL